MKNYFKQFTDRARRIFKRTLPVEVTPIKPPSALAEQADWDKKLVFSLAKQRFPSWQQLHYLPNYLSKKEKIIVRALLGVIIICLGFISIRYYQRHVIYLPRDGGKYSEATVGQPLYINPVLAQSDVDRDLTKLIYSGLFKYDTNLNLVPDLASGYEVSDDQKTYTIHLRPHVVWHNGVEVLADDVIYTFETIKDPGFNSPYYQAFKNVSVERIDDTTVKFTLAEPFAPFLTNLTIGILPAQLWSDLSLLNFKLAEYNIKPIGTGPFQFKELTKDRSGNIKSYVLVANKNYYGHRPHLDEITLRFYDSFASAVSAAQNNSTDGVSYTPKDLKASLDKNDAIVFHPLRLPQYTAVFINQKNTLLKTKEIRQALAYAVDKNNIVAEALNGQGAIINGPILEGMLGYNPDIKKYEYNPSQATDILEKAGWKIPDGETIRKKNGTELKFSITTVDQPEYTKTAEVLKNAWTALGANVDVIIADPATVDKEIIKPRSYDVFLYGEIIGADPDPYPFWHSSQMLGNGLNLSNYYNKDVDKLLEETRKLKDQNERANKYINFQNILAEDIPAIFLYNPYYDYGVQKKVKGISQERITIPSDRFNGIEDWYVKTKLSWK